MHPVIAANPACYPALIEWMLQLGTIAMDDENGDPVDMPELINTVVDSLNITLTGLELEAEEIEEGVSVVTIN